MQTLERAYEIKQQIKMLEAEYNQLIDFAEKKGITQQGEYRLVITDTLKRAIDTGDFWKRYGKDGLSCMSVSVTAAAAKYGEQINDICTTTPEHRRQVKRG